MLRLFDILRAIVVFKIVTCSLENDRNGKPLPRVATFHFPEYAYKETSKNEITYHEYELACGQNSLCVNANSAMVSKLNCLRQCISHSCYQDIYAFDELEEGEIDVRMNSFKGCVIQRMQHTAPMLHKLYFTNYLQELKWKFSEYIHNWI